MISFPFDSEVIGFEDNGMPRFDRAISSSQFRMINKTFYTNGIASGGECFKVIIGSNMLIKVKPGAGLINGLFFYEEQERTLQIQAAHATLDRIDRVVIRLNDRDRTTDLYVVKGTESSNPQPPSLTRNADIYELGIADIFVARSVTSITTDRITDTRLNKTLCGIIVGAIADINTNAFYDQLNAAVNKTNEIAKNALQGTLAGAIQTSIEDIKPRSIGAFTISSSSVSSISNQSWDTERKYGFRGYKSVSGMASNSKVDIVCDDPTSNIVGIAETTNGGFYVYCSEKKDLKVLEAIWIKKVGS